MKFKRRMAFVGEAGGKEIVMVQGEFAEYLLIIGGQVIGYVHPANLQEVIEKEVIKEEEVVQC